MAAYGKYTDTELFLLVKEGNEPAFAEIYRRYWPTLLRHAQRMLNDEEECRDVLQDVFVKLLNQAPDLELKVSLSAYLHTLVRHRVLDVLDRNKVRLKYLNQLDNEEDNATAMTDDGLLEREVLRLVGEELDDMPVRMREVFELSRTEQLSHREISEKLDISTSTVKFHINHALTRLRARLGL
ncbi:DNA-directed RNA polymerase sigma-70 factor [Parapedobacter defluvii]|uniref:DNA-directed RNA polymerase sigma-70 factor n=1 Tax=Parapedobacter defluvii TaxID=2045106 RepID=A0ABQ1M1R7_9SPHI|nr:RNA polymerase sigma-70 factor [Parapedobacter defluvii]GGC33307.1 DNA-directed RNA polymerase sigma-70 factor [Parapedobacter defluvii]